MNHRKITKVLLFFCIVLTMTFVLSLKSYASDYQYKVLDPKYNPYAQDLIDGKLSTPADEYVPASSSKKFDFAALFAAAALVIFPVGVFSFAIKTLKNVSNISDTETQSLGNITISKKEEEEDSEDDSDSTQETVEPVDEIVDEIVEETIIPEQKEIVDEVKLPTDKPVSQPAVAEKKETNKSSNSIDESLKKYFTSPVSKIPNPMLLNTSPLTRNKGLCVVEYNKKYSLIGYINNEIFLLDQFENLKNYEIRSRLTESKNSTDRYIVRLGEYKALVEVSDANMSLLLEL